MDDPIFSDENKTKNGENGCWLKMEIPLVRHRDKEEIF